MSHKLRKTAKESILCEEFWVSVNRLIGMLKLICLAIKEVERNDSQIHKVATFFSDLEKNFKNQFIKA